MEAALHLDGSGAASSGARALEPLQAFARLQQQVEMAVATIDRLRSENDRLQQELASTQGVLESTQKELISSQEMLQLTQDEVDRLQAERDEVCNRIQSVMASLQHAGLIRAE